MTVKILLSSFFCCCCQDQKVFSLSPLSAPRNNCDSFSSVSVSSGKCLGKVRRQEIFTQAALFFLRGLSSASLCEAIKRFTLVFGLVFVLPGVESTSGNNREKKKCCLSQSTLHTVWSAQHKAWPPCSDWKSKNTRFGLKMCFCIHVVITELRKQLGVVHTLIFSYLLIIISTGVSSQMQGRLGWLRHSLKNRHDKKADKQTDLLSV